MSKTLFQPDQTSTDMKPRPYQSEALEALNSHLATKESNPCVVIPTGGGKSILIAWAIQKWKAGYPPFRCAILAHRKELVRQNSDELHGLWPGGDIGVYSAGLRQKDTDNSIIYASIDSVYNKSGDFTPFDCLIIDEAHRIPPKGEGKYRKFIKGCMEWNPNLRVVGFTATPFRMGGPICHEDHILNEVCYEANIGDLIHDGYLCRLRSKIGHGNQPDLSNVRKNNGGDYIIKSLAEAVDQECVVAGAVKETVKAIYNESRKSCVCFCVDIEHCKHVSQEFRKYGIEAPYVTAKTPVKERDRIAEAFKKGRYRVLCNVNVYTEGFNAKRVDCIALMRPTESKGLYVQMVGRGLRLHPEKEDCLVLDFAHCIDKHGPIDAVDPGEVAIAECKECGDAFSRAIRVCPNCGWEIPKQEIERAEAEEREKRLHEAQASKRSILSGEPEEFEVDDVTVHRHRKPGSPDSLRVQYRCGLSQFREWICLDHGGFAERKARTWWARRFGPDIARTITVDDALSDLFLGQHIKSWTHSITVKRQGKYNEIINYRPRHLVKEAV